MSARPLSTTHHALLCLLSLRPWSAYALVGQMRRSLDLIWPRAQSNLYADLKRLADEGLVIRTFTRTGRRPRTEYALDPSGEQYLRAWLETPGAAPVFECEALVKLAYVGADAQAAALRQIDVLAQHAQDRLALGRNVATQYLEADTAAPRLHINAVMWRFLWEQHQAIARWAEWADEEVRRWPTTDDTPALRARGRELFAQAVSELDR